VSDFNQLTLSGRLTRDPIVRGEGDRIVTTLSVASNRQWPDGHGGFNEEVVFIDVCTFGRIAERTALRLKKGAHVFAAGRLQLNRWQDASSGETRQVIRVVASQVDSPSLRTNRPTEPQAETLQDAALRAAAEAAEAERAAHDELALAQNAAEMDEQERVAA
jgi:single stranded DNA-binding protein